MSEVIAMNPPVDWVKEQILRAGTTIGSVHFYKRTDGSLRKMCYRLHVHNPSIAKPPKGKVDTNIDQYKTAQVSKKDGIVTMKWRRDRRDIDRANDQITVLDANKTVRDESGKVIGRGAWRTIPLDKVVRISNKGMTYTINRN